MTHDNIVVNVLGMCSSNDDNSKHSDCYTCIVINLELFMLIMCIGFETLIIHLLDLDSIIRLSVVVVKAGSSSAAFVSPVSFINDKGDVYPFGFKQVFKFVIPRDTEVNKAAYEVI